VDIARRLASKRAATLSPQQAAVASWLRGNIPAMESLRDLLTARVEARGVSPIPSDPSMALIDKARDYECRAVLADLVVIFSSPLPSLQPGDEE
jgi:hypothetical protein